LTERDRGMRAPRSRRRGDRFLSRCGARVRREERGQLAPRNVENAVDVADPVDLLEDARERACAGDDGMASDRHPLTGVVAQSSGQGTLGL
jgi:hypothetical protein